MFLCKADANVSHSGTNVKARGSSHGLIEVLLGKLIHQGIDRHVS